MPRSYIEKSGFPKIVSILIVLHLFIISLILYPLDQSDIFIILIGLVVLLPLYFIKMKLVINEEGLRCRIGGISFMNLSLSDIETIKIIKISALTNFGGYGIRYSRSLGWAYIFDTNYAITLSYKGNKQITISINDKEKLKNHLDNLSINYSIE